MDEAKRKRLKEKLRRRQIERGKRERSHEPEQEGPGLGGAFVRGLYRSPAIATQMAESGGVSFKRFGHQGQAADTDGDGVYTINELASLPTRGQEQMETLSELSGQAEPQTYWERVMQSLGEQTPFILASTPGALATSAPAAAATKIPGQLVMRSAPLPAGPGAALSSAAPAGSNAARIAKLLATDVTIGTAATTGAEATREAGGGPLAQTGAGFATAMMFPAIGVPMSTRQLAAQRLRQGARVKPTKEAIRIAKKYGIKPEKVQEAVTEIKRRIGDKRTVRRVIDRLERPSLFDELADDAQPTSRQFMGRDAGQNFAGMEEGLARADVDASASIGSRRGNAAEDLTTMYDDFRPAGGIDDTIDRANLVAEDILADEASTWADVDLTGRKVNIRRVYEAMEESEELARGYSGRLPDEVGVLRQTMAEFGDEIDLTEFQRLRSNALLSQRIGGRATADSASQFKARNLSPIIRAYNEVLENLPNNVSNRAYRKALRLTRENKELLDPRSGYLRSIEQGRRGQSVVGQIRSSRGEARRAMTIASRSDGGVESLRATMLDDLFGESYIDASPNKIRGKLTNYREAFDEIFDDEIRQNIDMFIDALEVHKTGTAGTPAATRVAGSNIGPLGFLMAGAKVALHPLDAATSAVTAVQRRMAKDITTNIERSAILREAVLDRQLLLTLLKMPDQAALPAWMVNWERLVRRAETRSLATAGAEARTAITQEN